MDNFFLQYMERRFSIQDEPETILPGPLVTLSREFGCPSKLIATELTEELNRRPGHDPRRPWRYINKEVVEASARELEINPNRLTYLFNAERKGVFDDVLSSFGENYRSDKKIRKTISEVVRDISHKGYVVLVGRAGVAITRDHPRALHVRLQAPLEWRIQSVMKLRNITEAEARKLAPEMDKKRTDLIEMFLGRKFDSGIFDLVINCEKFSRSEVVGLILHAMSLKRY